MTAVARGALCLPDDSLGSSANPVVHHATRGIGSAVAGHAADPAVCIENSSRTRIVERTAPDRRRLRKAWHDLVRGMWAFPRARGACFFLVFSAAIRFRRAPVAADERYPLTGERPDAHAKGARAAAV